MAFVVDNFVWTFRDWMGRQGSQISLHLVHPVILMIGFQSYLKKIVEIDLHTFLLLFEFSHLLFLLAGQVSQNHISIATLD